MPRSITVSVFLALCLFVAAAIGCARGGKPAPPQPERRQKLILSSEHDDVRAGEEASREVESEMGLFDDPDVTRYVETIGRRILLYAPERPFQYHFAVVDQDVPNAFALPGGYVYVSRGLLALSNSEDALANVIAHEISHVAARHAAGRQEIASRGNILGIPGAIVGAVLGEKAGKRVANAITFTNPAYVAAYSRDQERAADRMGQKMVSEAGYDPRAMARFLKDLESTERLRFGASRLPSFLDTHPSTPKRAAEASSYAQTLVWQRRPGVTQDRSAFLETLAGITVGENPSEGVFEGSRFLHADLGFSVNFPDAWDTRNTRRAVGAVSPDRRSSFVLEFDSPGEEPERAANRYVVGDGLKVGFQALGGRAIRIGHLPAFRLEGKSVRSDGGATNAEITFVAFEGTIYRMTGASPGAVWSRHQGTIRNAARSFRGLTDEERALISGYRLAVVAAREGETLSELSARTDNRWEIQKTAVMNGIASDAPLRAGQLLKIARAVPYEPAPRAVDPAPAS